MANDNGNAPDQRPFEEVHPSEGVRMQNAFRRLPTRELRERAIKIVEDLADGVESTQH